MRTLSLCFLLLISGAASALGSDVAEGAEVLWTQATENMARGDDKGALAQLQRLSEQHAGDALADDALFLAATLLEEKLGKPAEAKAAYEQLLRLFPDSRAALAAERRLRVLTLSLGPEDAGAEALVAFQDLLSRYPERGDDESLALATALLAKHANWSGSHRIQLWIAENSRRLGYLDRASFLFEEIRKSDAPAAARLHASLGAADVKILQARFGEANQLLEELKGTELSPANRQAVEELRSRAELAASRARWLIASYVLVAGMLLLLLLAARRSAKNWSEFAKRLRSPPIEAIYMLPLAVLLVAMAYTGHEEIGPAVAIICGGGLVVSWVSANALRAPAELSRRYALFCTSAATIAALSLCYLALHRGQLLDLLNTTLASGPE